MAERDLTTGPLAGHLAAIAAPAAFGMLFATLYNIVDTYFAGWISTEAQAGLGVSFAGFMVFVAVASGLSQGAGAVIGAALGARRTEEARDAAAGALALALGVGVLLGGLGAAHSGTVLQLIGAEPAVFAAADSYLTLLFLGLPSFLIGFTANGVLTAQGDARSNRNAQIAAFFANCGLNPLLIYGALGLPGLGFDGIALATVLIQSVVAVWMARRALRSRAMRGVALRSFAPSRAILTELLRQGAPASLTMLVMMIGAAIMLYHLQPFGAAAVAGFNVAFRVEQLILLPILAISFALMPLVAQNHGAGEADRVRQSMTLAATVALAGALVGAVALRLGGVAMTGMFTDDPAAIASGAAYLSVASLMMPAYALMFLIVASFQGLKRPVWSVVVGLYRQIFALALYPWIGVELLGWGLQGVWAGLFAAVWSGFLLAAVLLFLVGGRALGGFRPDFAALRGADA